MAALLDLWTTTRLRLLVELERSGSLSQAASAVGLSQPSASEHIRVINAAAAEPIVSRKGRSLQLTPAGRIVAAYAAHALGNLVAGESALAARAGLRTGTLRLGASSVPGTYIVPDVLEAFHRQAPDIVVELSVGSTAEVRQWLLSGRIACAVTCGENTDDRIASTAVGPDEIVGVAHPELIELSSTAQVRPAQLDGLTLLVQERGSSTRDYAQSILEGSPYHFLRTWELGSVDGVKRAACLGSGVGFLSTHTISEERRRGELISFELQDVPKPVRRVSLLRMSRSLVNPAEKYFELLLMAHLKKTDLIQAKGRKQSITRNTGNST